MHERCNRPAPDLGQNGQGYGAACKNGWRGKLMLHAASQCAILPLSITARKGATQCKLQQSASIWPNMFFRSMGLPKVGRFLQSSNQARPAYAILQQSRTLSNWHDRVDPWAIGLLERKPARLATVAMANTTARIIWDTLLSDKPFETWSRKPSRPEATYAAQKGRTHVCF